MKVWMPALLLAVLITTGIAWLMPRLLAAPDRFQLARTLLDQGRAEEAVHLFETPDWKGVAEYRAGRYHRALGAFVQQETVANLYNMGNAYAHLHEWRGAQAAFEQALRLDPGHADARHNLAIVIEAERLDQARLAETRNERRLGTWRDGDSDGKADDQDAAGKTVERQDLTQGRTRASERRSALAGESTTQGRLGEARKSTETMAGVAGGETADEQDTDVTGAAPVAALRRESAQAAEILLRRIGDDPARVLTARLRAIDRQRRKREGTCTDC